MFVYHEHKNITNFGDKLALPRINGGAKKQTKVLKDVFYESSPFFITFQLDDGLYFCILFLYFPTAIAQLFVKYSPQGFKI